MIPLFRVRCDEWKFYELAHECFTASYIGEGPKVLAFEEAIARVYGVEPWQVVAVNSGTSAIMLGLLLCGVKPGDGVVVSSVTCMADSWAVKSLGANIEWADIDPETGLAEAHHVEAARTKRTKAALITDLSGTTPRTAHDEIPTVQDSAQNFMGKMWAPFVAGSCQAIKTLTTADGGYLIVRTTKEDAKKARLIRWFGLDRTASADFRCQQNITSEYGAKWHLSDLLACLGLANIPLAMDSTAKQRENARWYQENLPPSVLVPFDPTGSYWTYMVLLDRRDAFIEYARANGVHASPVQSIGTRHDAFPKANLPGAERYSSRNCAIPSGWWVSPEDREKIAALVREWVAR